MQRITEVGGLFIGGNPVTNTKGTVVTADWANAVQEEIARAIEIAGIVLSGSSNEQLSAAIAAMITARVASTAAAGIVELATSAETQSGSSAVLAVTPSGLASRSATETRTGLAELATPAEVAAGSDTTRIVVPATLNGLFVGSVLPFAMSSAPAGWLKCNGAAVSRTTYAALFAAIGTVFGSGDGTTTFNLPDLRAEHIRGWDDGRGVDSGRVFGSYQSDEIKAHTHNIETSTSTSAGSFDGVSGRPDGLGPAVTKTAKALSTGGTETRPRNVALLVCIKY